MPAHKTVKTTHTTVDSTERGDFNNISNRGTTYLDRSDEDFGNNTTRILMEPKKYLRGSTVYGTYGERGNIHGALTFQYWRLYIVIG